MIGQDNPVNDSAFNTKTIQFRLDDAKNKDGLFIPKAPFPVREFAEWLLARWTTETASNRLKAHEASLEQNLKRDPNDKNIGRFVQNYAALQFATEELFEFSGYRNESIWQTITDMMNHHLAASVTIRRESVAILEKLVEEMMLATRTEDQIIHKVESGCLIIPTNAILPYLNRRGHTSPVTSTVTLAEHFERDGFALQRNASRRINGKKAKCVVLSLAKLKNAGIDWPFDESDGEEP
ncbi:MAG: hypothetical protein HQL81_16575 [Magnetococcales bacterium]|nr:hypothetical protein [Magnetococcales bacterium]